MDDAYDCKLKQKITSQYDYIFFFVISNNQILKFYGVFLFYDFMILTNN
jgi:hypothetical protein